MNSWICDGVAKNDQQYPDKGGQHEPYENFGPDCAVCGLPTEAMQPGKTKTKTKGKTQLSTGRPLTPLIIGLVSLGVILGIGLIALKLLTGNHQTANQTPQEQTNSSPSNSDALVSEGATNGQFISQGEKILLEQTQEKQNAASQFASKNWESASTAYQQATNANRNDPESKIYLNNAQAHKKGNPLTIAVAIPITSSPDSAKEILRGVAQAQTEFNQSATQPLEVVIFNYGNDLQASSIAQDITKGNILAIIGYGIDPASNQALSVYEKAGIPVLSPLTTSVNQSTLQTIPLSQKANQLSANYLQAVGKTLAKYASQQHPSPTAVIFYNSDSPYSLQLKQELVNALPSVQGKVVKQIDTVAGGFNAATEVANAKSSGANTIFLALSKSKLAQAIMVAQANKDAGSPMLILGGDELYNPDFLIQGGDAVAGITLAVPWSFQPGDPFAQNAVTSWKGRVSWRTATAYDATKSLAATLSQHPKRSDLAQQLNQGVTMTGNATNFQTFQEVPLVKAVKGNSGPPGSQYQFDPVP